MLPCETRGTTASSVLRATWHNRALRSREKRRTSRGGLCCLATHGRQASLAARYAGGQRWIEGGWAQPDHKMRLDRVNQEIDRPL